MLWSAAPFFYVYYTPARPGCQLPLTKRSGVLLILAAALPFAPLSVTACGRAMVAVPCFCCAG